MWHVANVANVANGEFLSEEWRMKSEEFALAAKLIDQVVNLAQRKPEPRVGCRKGKSLNQRSSAKGKAWKAEKITGGGVNPRKRRPFP